MVYKMNPEDFFGGLDDLRDKGSLDFTNEALRLKIANDAYAAIEYEGGILSSYGRGLFTYAMVGLPEFDAPESLEELNKPFVRGLWALGKDFSAQTADMPFVPGDDGAEGASTFKAAGYKQKLPYRINIRGREPYTRLPQGSGLDEMDSSLEYQVLKNPVTNRIVGRVIARGCFRVSLEEIFNYSYRGVYGIPVYKGDVVLYQAARNATELPKTLPTVQPAKFGLNIFTSGKQQDVEFPSSRFSEALSVAVKAAQNRGDYNGLPNDVRD